MALAEHITDLLAKISTKRAAIIIALLFSAFWALEWQAKAISFYKPKEAADILERINKLDNNKLDNQSQELRTLLIKQTTEAISPTLSIGTNKKPIDTPEYKENIFLKFICGCAPWIVISAIGTFGQKKGSESRLKTFLAMQIITISFGLLYLLLPSFGSAKYDYLIMPWSIILVLFTLTISTIALISIKKVRREAKIKTIRSQLRQIESANCQYQSEKGHPPKSIQEIVGNGKFIKDIKKPPRRRLQQNRPKQHNTHIYHT